MECSGKEVTKEGMKLDWEEKVWGNRRKIGQKRPVTFKQVHLSDSIFSKITAICPAFLLNSNSFPW